MLYYTVNVHMMRTLTHTISIRNHTQMSIYTVILLLQL